VRILFTLTNLENWVDPNKSAPKRNPNEEMNPSSKHTFEVQRSTEKDHLCDIVDTKNGVYSFEADHRLAHIDHIVAAVAVVATLLSYFYHISARKKN
jgi:hypothetical protein